MALTACAVPQQQAAAPAVTQAGATGTEPYEAMAFTDLPGWTTDQVTDALPALKLSCARFALLPQDQALGGSGVAAQLGGKAGNWLGACQAADALTPGDAAGFRTYLQTWFTPYRLQQDGSSAAMLTGYYEPEVSGSMVKYGSYQTPLLARPRDLVEVSLGDFDPSLMGKVIFGHISGATLAPYFTRAEIEAGALKPQKLELLYLSSPSDAYMVQIQGAGLVDLPGDQTEHVVYAGKNGLPYVSIGQMMIDQGLIPANQISMQAIRTWLSTHPDQAQTLMDQNPSYVFFRVASSISPQQGPPGSLGVSLTAGRSLAVDRAIVPLGAPMWMSTTDPVDGTALQRLMVAQDTGAAITGPLRADIFFGTGPSAGERAGRARQSGTLYVLLPRTAASGVVRVQR